MRQLKAAHDVTSAQMATRSALAAARIRTPAPSKIITLALVSALVWPGQSVMAQLSVGAAPAISETVVMLYYKDITAAAAFYGEVLGLDMTYDQDSAKLFRLTPTSVLGVILEGETSYHKVQASNAVMLSIVTPDVDAWYQRLTSDKGIKILKPIANSDNNPIRAFLVEDPGGYTVEFFSWLNTPEPGAAR